MLHVMYMLVPIDLHTCYVTVTLLSRKLQLTYTLHVTLCLLGTLFLCEQLIYLLTYIITIF